MTKIDKVAARLEGQCVVSLEQAFEEEDLEDTLENRRLVDEQVFLCDCCGWWSSSEDLYNDNPNGEELCDECHEEDED